RRGCSGPPIWSPCCCSGAKERGRLPPARRTWHAARGRGMAIAMIAARLMSWVGTVAIVYAILLLTYAAGCLIVLRLNRRIQAAKLQSRTTPPAQIRRDQR